MTADIYRVYRIQLQALVHTPMDASDQDIHELIEPGFPISPLKTLVQRGPNKSRRV
jgi:hypothetical protein